MTARRGTPVAQMPPSAAGIAHVDYGLCGGSTTAVVVLRHSCAVWAEPIESVTARDLGRAMVHAVRYFGGSPRCWRFEGPAVGIATWGQDRWVFAPELVELARLCTAELDVYSGHGGILGRGLCEGVLHSLGRRWVLGGRPGNADAVARLRIFHDRAARRTRHPFLTERKVAQVLAVERPLLLPAPDGLEALFAGEGEALA